MIAEAVFVAIEVPGHGGGVVDRPVAVVVCAVADLGRLGVNRCIVVVTISGLQGRGSGGCAAWDCGAIAPGVSIAVGVPVQRFDLADFVHVVVAIVVSAIAAFGSAGKGGRVGVVAVPAALDHPDRRLAGDHRRAAPEAIGVTVRKPIRAHDIVRLVHAAVAIVVQFVARFSLLRKYRRLGVVAVAAHLGNAVPIVVGELRQPRLVRRVVEDAGRGEQQEHRHRLTSLGYYRPMTWIRPVLPRDPQHARYLERLYEVRAGLPSEYAPPEADSRLPKAVARDSIIASHALLPDVMFHMFAGFRAMLAPELPLSRREQELIGVVVSRANDCFY